MAHIPGQHAPQNGRRLTRVTRTPGAAGRPQTPRACDSRSLKPRAVRTFLDNWRLVFGKPVLRNPLGTFIPGGLVVPPAQKQKQIVILEPEIPVLMSGQGGFRTQGAWLGCPQMC